MRYQKIILSVFLMLVLITMSLLSVVAMQTATADKTVFIERVTCNFSNGANGKNVIVDDLDAALYADFSLPEAWISYTFAIRNGSKEKATFSDFKINFAQTGQFIADTAEIQKHIGDTLSPNESCTITFIVSALTDASFISVNNEQMDVRFVFEGQPQESISGGATSGGHSAGNSNHAEGGIPGNKDSEADINDFTPQTGDRAIHFIWLAIAALGGAALSAIMLSRKGVNHDKKR